MSLLTHSIQMRTEKCLFPLLHAEEEDPIVTVGNVWTVHEAFSHSLENLNELNLDCFKWD